MQLWADILTIAGRAPSPHNIQPWRIRLDSETEATLFLDAARTLPKTDHTGSFTTSAMTMLLEAILMRNIDTLFDDLNDREYQGDLVPWFRYSNRQTMRERDGLDYRCMNLSPAEFWLAAHTPQVMQAQPSRAVLKRIYRAQLGEVYKLGYIRGPFWDRNSALHAGHFLMRFWLELATHDLYIHPFGNLVTNPVAANWMAQQLGHPDIWLIFKIGYSAEPAASLRKPLEEILL
jgi:hypothetical protein